MKKLKTEKTKVQEGKQLSAGILLAVELESNFKLYSYRCIEPENFLQRIDQLIKVYDAVRSTNRLPTTID
jgi:hypothetical protein